MKSDVLYVVVAENNLVAEIRQDGVAYVIAQAANREAAETIVDALNAVDKVDAPAPLAVV